MSKKNILITGSQGFIGKNLLKQISKDHNIYEFHRKSTLPELSTYINKIDFIFHLAGEVRPNCTIEEYEKGNISLTHDLINIIEKNNLKIPILVTSSTHAIDPKNEYGISKQASDTILIKYAKKNNVNVYIYKLPHIFGEGCKPNYNSVITTWIYNSIHNLPIHIYSRDIKMKYTYIQDFIQDAIKKLNSKESQLLYSPSIIYDTTLGEVYDILSQFKNENYILDNDFKRKLYKTYNWYKENLE